MYQCFLYIRDPNNPSEPDSNHYALPLPISPVICTESLEVVRIDRLPLGPDNTVTETQPYKIRPPNEYIPECQDLRTDLKPLNVVQPEGASFQVTEQGTSTVLEWQKWRFRVGFNQREGMVLYDVSYTHMLGRHRGPTGLTQAYFRSHTKAGVSSTASRSRT